MSAPGRSPLVRIGAAGVALVAMLGAATFVAARLAAYDGDPSAFVRVGENRVRGATPPDDLLVFPDEPGYDGQFFYRLSRAPFSTDERVDGIEFDRPSYRATRFGYPLAVWTASLGGTRTAVPWALIGVNVAAIGLLTFIVSRAAVAAGRSPWWGLVIGWWPGTSIGLSLDLAEPVAAALLASGLALVADRRHTAAAAVLCFAAVTRETTLLLPLACLGASLVHRVAGRGRFHAWGARLPARLWAAPLITYVAAQVIMESRFADAESVSGKQASFVRLPLANLYDELRRWIDDPGAVAPKHVLLVSAVLAVGIALTSAVIASTTAAHERWAILGAAGILFAVSSWGRFLTYLRYPLELLVLGLPAYLRATDPPIRRPVVLVATAVAVAVATPLLVDL